MKEEGDKEMERTSKEDLIDEKLEPYQQYNLQHTWRPQQRRL